MWEVRIDEERCVDCGFCRTVNVCSSPNLCILCFSCLCSCPNMARRVVWIDSEPGSCKVEVEGIELEVPRNLTVKKALSMAGVSVGLAPGEGDVSAPCRTGGCYSCLVEMDGEPVRACITPVRDGASIRLYRENQPLLRIVHGPEPHMVGGKGTPWWVKGRRYVEVAIWAAGCNLRCPQCQNYHVTYDNASRPITPREAAVSLTAARIAYGVNRMAISGGEPTVNRRWLIEFFRELRRLNRDDKARLHLDSNGTLLTKDYIDELVEAGVTDIGVEPKGARVETFMKITGIRNRPLAQRYLETAWRALDYLISEYSDRVFVGVGIPYNRAFMMEEELWEIGERIASISRDVQVVVLDYFPTFRNRRLRRPSFEEMLRVKRILGDAGLRTVIVQTSIGHIGPNDELL